LNYSATNNLIANAFFASSVHCSYYSCVQFMYHILSSHCQKSNRQISDESFDGSKVQGGLHNWLINTIFAEFGNKMDANTFDELITDLQFLRVRSDYKNEVIEIDHAISAKNTARKTLNVLKRNFKT